MDVLYDVHDRVATISLNRPAKHNAMNVGMYRTISDHLKEIDEDSNVLVGIVTGGNDASFSAGADLRELADSEEAEDLESAFVRGRFDQGLRVRKPLIAAINGYCLAGGLELALFCDIRIASDSCKFGCPEVKWNLLHGYGAYNLPQIVGLSNALYLLLSGEFIDSEAAHRMGLVQLVTDKSELLPVAYQLAGTIAGNAPLAVEITKELAMRSYNSTVDSHLTLYRELNSRVRGSSDQQEGLSAFAERRIPEYDRTPS